MDAGLLRECDANYWASNDAFFGTSRNGGFAETDDVALWHCGFPQPEFNRAFLKEPEGDVPAAISAAERHFAGIGLPFCFECRSDRVDACAGALSAGGYDPAGRTPAMSLQGEKGGAPHPQLAISEVVSDEDLALFQSTAFLGFGLPEQAGPLFLTPQLRALPQVMLYLGRIDGTPVCTSALVLTGEVAGIYWVATREDSRGRGLGAAITQAAVDGGRSRGGRIASLQASDLGRPVYERMGFETPVHYVKFERRRA
jgi:GNAT superfamily N-acetyltransferase